MADIETLPFGINYSILLFAPNQISSITMKHLTNDLEPREVDNPLSKPVRKTVRMVVLDQEDRILLIKVKDSSVQDPNAQSKKNPFWITPGGKVEDGENLDVALSRELQEETGLIEPNAQFVGCIAVAEYDLIWKGVLTHIHESFFLVCVQNPAVSQSNITDEEKRVFKRYRWWDLNQLACSHQIVLPVNLVELATSCRGGRLPSDLFTVDTSTPEALSF